MQTKQEGISPSEMMKTEQAIYKARGLAFRHLDGDRLGVFVAFNGEKKGFDAILHNDAEAVDSGEIEIRFTGKSKGKPSKLNKKGDLANIDNARKALALAQAWDNI